MSDVPRWTIDDICSHGRPNHQDLIHELRGAVGLFAGAMPITPQQAWNEAIDVARRGINERDELEADAIARDRQCVRDAPAADTLREARQLADLVTRWPLLDDVDLPFSLYALLDLLTQENTE